MKKTKMKPCAQERGGKAGSNPVSTKEGCAKREAKVLKSKGEYKQKKPTGNVK